MRIPRWLILPTLIITLLHWVNMMFNSDEKASVFDLPKTLDREVYTLTVYPVSRLNNVAIWSTSRAGMEDDYLYLTPASGTVLIPSDLNIRADSGYSIQVHGKFYKGRGIPEEYFHLQPKPERLRVFQFDSLQVLPVRVNDI